MPYISNKLRPYKQITRLNKYHNCLIEGDIVELQYLGIWFDQINDIAPTKLEFYNGKCKTYYTDLNIIKIINNESLNKTYDDDNSYLLYYDDPYVNNFKNLIKQTQNKQSLVNRYILDWKFNKNLIRSLMENKSEYIELNYYIYF